MMTYIIIDSNILFKRNYTDYSVFYLAKIYDDVVGKIQLNNVEEHFEVLIPEIAINELYRQQVEHYNDSIKTLQTLKDKVNQIYEINIEVDSNFDYEKFLKRKKEEYIKAKDVKVLPICSKNRFENIVIRALEKRPPFLGKTKESDKGFKDALIWESILDFAEKNNGDFIFLTSDKGFDEDLIAEFYDLVESHMKVIKKDDLNQLDKIIEEISNNQQAEKNITYINNYLENIKKELISDVIRKDFQNVKLNSLLYKVEDFSSDYIVKDINKVGTKEFNFYMNGTLKATKSGAELEVLVKLYFSLELNENHYNRIDKILLDDVEILTLDNEFLEFDIPNYTYTINEYSDENFEKFDDFLESESTISDDITKMVDNDLLLFSFSKYEKDNYLNFIRSSLLYHLIDDEDLIKLVDIIEFNYSKDWWDFKSKVSQMKIALKKFFKINKNLSLSSDLDVFIEDLINFEKEKEVITNGYS